MERRSLSLNNELFAFYSAGVEYGPLGEFLSEVRWDHQTFAGMGRRSSGFYYLSGPGQLAWEPRYAVDGDGLEWTLGPSERGESSVRRDGRIRREIEAIGREASTRNSTNVGCRWTFERVIGPGRSVRDNYWDFSFRAISINLRIRGASNTAANCTWNMPFSSPHYTVLNYHGRRVSSGGEGQIFVALPETTRSHAFIRAIALNVQNRNVYLSTLLPTPGLNDDWAIIVQNSRNGGTACEALLHSPTQTDAVRRGRVYLAVELRGANPNCPQRAYSAIACVATGSRRTNSASSLYGAVEAPVFRTESLSGMGECILPAIE